MARPPAPIPDDVPGSAASLGAVLIALLAALLGGARAGRRARAYSGVMAAVPPAPVDLLDAPAVEWIATPAPWRARQGIGRPCPRLRGPAGPCGAMRIAVRGPPRPTLTPSDAQPGMA